MTIPENQNTKNLIQNNYAIIKNNKIEGGF